MSDMRLLNLPRLSFGGVLLAVITLVSSGLSAYCGWMLAHGTNIVIQSCSAGAGATIALLLAINTTRAANAYANHDAVRYRSLMRYCLLLAVFNWVTDFGAASVLRDATNVASKNVNLVAAHKRGEVERMEARLSKIREDLEQYKDTKTSGFYEAELIKLKSTLGGDGRNIWQRSRECADVTVKESQEHCAEIAATKQGISDANRKRTLEDERLTLTQQLPAAKLASQNNEQQSNPVVAQIGNFAAFVLLSFEQTDGQIKWGVLIFTLLWTMVFSVIIFKESWADGLASAHVDELTIPRNPYLSDHRPEARRDSERGRETIVLQSETIRRDQATDALEKALDRLRKKYKAEAA